MTGWARLADDAVDFEGPFQRLGERVMALADPDGLRVELIESRPVGDDPRPQARDGSAGTRQGTADGFHSVTLWLDDPGPTARCLSMSSAIERQAKRRPRRGAAALPRTR
jgi:glyoxalase family protein